MDERKNAVEMLKRLLCAGYVEIEDLSNCLELSEEQVRSLSYGNIDILPQEFSFRCRIFCKIQFLYESVSDDKDERLCRFLQKLLTEYDLTKEEIAQAANVKIDELEKCLCCSLSEVSAEARYRIAAAVIRMLFSLHEAAGNEKDRVAWKREKW